MAYEYVVKMYDVPACTGRRVVMDGKPGIIVKDMGHHIGVNFDEDKPGVVSPCHPTWEMEYGEIGEIRKPTRSQLRYQRYLEMEECFDDFKHFLLWECRQGKLGVI